jgi:hypothetical protein
MTLVDDQNEHVSWAVSASMSPAHAMGTKLDNKSSMVAGLALTGDTGVL